MARFIPAILIVVLLTGWIDPRGRVWVERASPAKPYDFVVHVSNIAKIKYNPLVLEDRHRMGLGVMVFLIVLSGLLYFSYRRVWKDAH